jgi:ubiquinone/menaquinone biosynthesis C-methylase UbiE
VALEAEGAETLRIEKWGKIAKNWLVEYADRRASDFVQNVIEDIARLRGSANILDVGCGPGKWTRLFAERFSTVTAIDISPEMIALAQKSLNKKALDNVHFHVMSVSKLHFKDNHFDFVNCITVLQHILNDNDWKLAVKEIGRVTKPGGSILLYEFAPSLVIKRRTPHLNIRSMKHYVHEFEKADAVLTYWRAVDLSLPITFFGLKNYAASFNKKVHYFLSKKAPSLSPDVLSILSKIAAVLANPIDYRFGQTPLGLLSLGRLMLFTKNA